MPSLAWIREVLKERALRKERARKIEILRRDRLVCPPELKDLEGVPLNGFMMKRIWSLAGMPSTKFKREYLIPEGEEAKEFVGHVIHEEGDLNDPLTQSMPIILSLEKETLEEIIRLPFMLLNMKMEPHEVIRHSWAMVTLDMGWALPHRGGRMDRPGLPWKYLLHPEDYQRINAKNKLAFWLALGYKSPENAVPERLTE